MIIARPSFSELPIADINVSNDRLRIVSEAKVTALMELITVYGFMGQIRVRRANKKNTLIDGAHRLEAARRLGLASIPVEVLECSLPEARQLEIHSNLLAGMTPLQDGIFLAEWEQQEERLHPELRRGVAGAMAKQGVHYAFMRVAETVAEARQISPSQVRKIIQAVRRLSVDEKASLQKVECKLPMDGIIQIGKLANPEEREAVIRKLSLGAAKSVSQARRAWAAEVSPDAEPVGESTKDLPFNTLLKAWNRAPMATKQRFARELADELAELAGGAA